VILPPLVFPGLNHRDKSVVESTVLREVAFIIECLLSIDKLCQEPLLS
jgi:hypothetical protein